MQNILSNCLAQFALQELKKQILQFMSYMQGFPWHGTYVFQETIYVYNG